MRLSVMIETKYFGPTNFRGSRVKATNGAKSVTIPWESYLDVAENHEAAAMALAKVLDEGCMGRLEGLVMGQTRKDGYIFAFVRRGIK